MIERFRECGPAITSEVIADVEQAIGVRFPVEYKSFLLVHNGGRPEPNAFPIKNLVNNPFGTVQVFLGINHEIESCNLDWVYRTMDGRLPDNLLAIARDDGGDFLCVSLYGEDEGEVVFWDRHQERLEPSYINVYRVAPSFPKFLDGIQSLPE